jgi:putative flippase GtrA
MITHAGGEVVVAGAPVSARLACPLIGEPARQGVPDMLSGPMITKNWIPADRLRTRFPRAAALVAPHVEMLRKAVSFALIGVVNVVVDTSVFLLGYSYLKSGGAALRLLDALVRVCGCTSTETAMLIAANTLSWIVAMSGSYVMNSFITFAAESGRRLRWRDYVTFAVSGIAGAVTNTAVLVVAAQLMPVLAAKGCAILVAFVVNFTMTHFVVFHPSRRAA